MSDLEWYEDVREILQSVANEDSARGKLAEGLGQRIPRIIKVLTCEHVWTTHLDGVTACDNCDIEMPYPTHPAPAAARAEEACIYTKADAEALCAIAVAAAQPDAAKYRALTTPEIHNFIVAVEREALHQRDRWAAEHDAGKTDADWFWLVGYLAGKAINKPDKILHHIITTAAACLNWHAAKLGTHTAMRPGIEEPK